MEEKITHQFCIQVFDAESRRALAALLTGKTKEQPEGIAISGNRIRTCLHLVTQAVGEKLLEKFREGRWVHPCTFPTEEPVTLWEASSSNSGTASIYQ